MARRGCASAVLADLQCTYRARYRVWVPPPVARAGGFAAGAVPSAAALNRVKAYRDFEQTIVVPDHWIVGNMKNVILASFKRLDTKEMRSFANRYLAFLVSRNGLKLRAATYEEDGKLFTAVPYP